MLTNFPSLLQFISSLVFLIVFVFVSRAFITWLLKINTVLAHLRAISEAVGVPESKTRLVWPLNGLQARRAMSRPPVASSEGAAAVESPVPCPCCGSVVRAGVAVQPNTNL